MKSLAVLLLAGLASANAQPVFHDSKTPQVSFAVSEIRRSLAGQTSEPPTTSIARSWQHGAREGRVFRARW